MASAILVQYSTNEANEPVALREWSSTRRELYVFILVLVSIEEIYQTLKTVFEHTFKHVEGRQKCSAAHRMFNSFLIQVFDFSWVFPLKLHDTARKNSYCNVFEWYDKGWIADML